MKAKEGIWRAQFVNLATWQCCLYSNDLGCKNKSDTGLSLVVSDGLIQQNKNKGARIKSGVPGY